MKIAQFKIKKLDFKIIVLVYHDGVKDDSELMKDMRDNYIPSIASECGDDQEIELMTFRTKCKSR